jgi:hypothetical protein
MTFTTCRRAFACGLTAALLAATPGTAAPTDPDRARMGVRYLVSHQSPDGSFPGFSALASTADAVVAMVAARRAPGAIEDALGYLRTHVEEATLGQKASLALAAVAGGRDPRAFGGSNLIRQIRDSKTPQGQYLDPEPDNAEPYTQALAMLALHAAGADVPVDSAQWLADAQCQDGGWQFDAPAEQDDDEHCYRGGDDFSLTDTNTTAYAVMALEAAPDVPLAASPFAYFKTARDAARGGWKYDHRRSPFGFRSYTDANSTSLVLQAFKARGKAAPRGSRAALRDLQYELCGATAGAFAYTWTRSDGKWSRSPSRQNAELGGATSIGATIAAIPGILGRTLPIPELGVTQPAPARPACR